jgi:hypothetical protein
VRRTVIDETLEQVEKLVNELRAISHWNAEHQRRRCLECYETIAYVSRQHTVSVSTSFLVISASTVIATLVPIVRTMNIEPAVVLRSE